MSSTPDIPASTGQTSDARSLGAGDLAGQVLDNRYEIVNKVGEGGMCVVYLAHDRASGERVAIKILLPALMADATSMARLRREAALGRKLDHANVCHITTIGESSDGFDYAVMPFLDGELLRDRAARAGHLPLDATVVFVRDMCAGLAAAHRLGIIHRDLKPENVMVVRGSHGAERAVVMDFSLATARGVPALTTPGLVVGTPVFMSPEQLRGQELDARSDVYSLALMVYEMLTGELPFEGNTQQEIVIARLKGALTPIRTKRADLNIPVAIERVLTRALAHDADERYQTAEKFGQAFARAAVGKGTDGGVWRWIRGITGGQRR